MASGTGDRARRRGQVPASLVAAAVAALLGASCAPMPGGAASQPATPAPDRPRAAASPPGPSPAPAPEVPRELRFTAPQLGGGTIRGATYAGQDLVVWFWAPW